MYFRTKFRLIGSLFSKYEVFNSLLPVNNIIQISLVNSALTEGQFRAMMSPKAEIVKYFKFERLFTHRLD